MDERFLKAKSTVETIVEEKATRKKKKVDKAKKLADQGLSSFSDLRKETKLTVSELSELVEKDKMERLKERKRIREEAEVAEWDRLDAIRQRSVRDDVVHALMQFKGRSQCAAEAGTTMRRAEMIAQAEGLPVGFFDMPIDKRIFFTVHRFLVKAPKKQKPKKVMGRPEKYDELELKKNGKRWVVYATTDDGFKVAEKFSLTHKKAEISWKMWESGKCKFSLVEKFEGNIRRKEDETDNN